MFTKPTKLVSTEQIRVVAGLGLALAFCIHSHAVRILEWKFCQKSEPFSNAW